MEERPVKALFVVAEPTADTPAQAWRGLEVRAAAIIRGRCACGGEADIARGRFEHQPNCPAISRAVERALERGQVRWRTVPALVSLSQ
jgi:hypothetical protein